MLQEIVISAVDRPGALAEIGEVLGREGVNIETLSAFAHDGRGTVHLVVDDGEQACQVLQANGFEVEGTRPVLSVTLDDRPGELGRYCRRLADAGVSISGVYVARRDGGETELIFGVDDIAAAHRA